MPLTGKGTSILEKMKENYGEKKGEQVFYASKNKVAISGVDAIADAVAALEKRYDAMAARYDGRK